MTYSPAEVRKLVVALVGALGQAVDAGLVPAQYKPYVSVVLAFATAYGVYAVPNGTGAVSPRSAENDDYEPIEEPPAEEPTADSTTDVATA
jgi:hypothetical protein